MSLEFVIGSEHSLFKEQISSSVSISVSREGLFTA